MATTSRESLGQRLPAHFWADVAVESGATVTVNSKQMVRIASRVCAKLLGGFVLNINVFGSSIHFGSPKLRTLADRSCARPLVCALALFAIIVISARAAQDQPGPYKYNGKIHLDLKSVPTNLAGTTPEYSTTGRPRHP